MSTLFRLLVKSWFKPDKSTHILLANRFFKMVFGQARNFRYSVHFTTILASPDKIFDKGGENLVKSFANSGNCYFSAFNEIHFGYNVLFAPNVQIISSNHHFDLKRQPMKGGPVTIGDNVWIGTNVTILPEVEIGENSIIGAGAVISKNIPRNSIVIGNPQRVIGKLCNCGNKLRKKTRNEFICDNCSSEFSLDDLELT